MPNELLWIAHEHQHAEHGRDWYWALGIVAVATAGIAVIFGNYLFALLIVVAALSMGLVAKRPAEPSTFKLDDRGLHTNDMLYPYDAISEFWVSELEEEPILIVNTTRFLMPHLVIPLPADQVEIEEVREFLRTQGVTETELREPISLRILEFFGF